MSTHTALPADVIEDRDVNERPAAGRWHRASTDAPWLVKVRASVHRPGRIARVRGRERIAVVELGEVVSTDGEFVLSAFTDTKLRTPGHSDEQPSDKQRDLLRRLWDEHGGGLFVNTANGHVIGEPAWDDLTKDVTRWYIDMLKGGAR